MTWALRRQCVTVKTGYIHSRKIKDSLLRHVAHCSGDFQAYGFHVFASLITGLLPYEIIHHTVIISFENFSSKHANFKRVMISLTCSNFGNYSRGFLNASLNK